MAAKVTNTISQTVLPSWYTNYAQQVLSNQNALSAQPYQAYQGPRVAGFTPQQTQGFDLTKQAATSYQPSLSNAQSTLTGAIGRSGSAVAQPFFQQASQISPTAAAQQNLGLAGAMGASGAQMSGLSAAQPYINTAGLSTADITNQYMSPYLDNVVNRIGELGVRTLNEQVLPGISDTMIGAGQYGGTRQAELMGRSVRDAMSEIAAQQAAALNTGYTQAQNVAQGDLTRYGALASTVGNLAGQDQQGMYTGAQLFSTLGGQQAALSEADRSFLANQGSTLAGLYNQDTSNQFQGASTLAQLAQQQQQQGLAGAAAVTGVGNQQQALNQSNLDAAYQAYQAQQAYAQQQINNQIAAMQGVSAAVPNATAQVSSSKIPSGSTLSQLGSIASTALGVGSTLGLGGTAAK